MAGVSTLAQLNAQLRRFDTLGTQFANLQNSLSSNKKTDTYDGLGSDSLSTLRYRTTIQGGEQFIRNITIATTRIEAVTGSVSLIQKQVEQMQKGILQQPIEGQTNLSDVKAYTAKLLQTMPGNLNQQVDGRYVLAGADYEVQPYNGDDKLKTLVAQDLADWKDGTITTEQLLTKFDSYTDDEVGFSAEVITAGNVNVRADTDINMDYTFKANDPSIKKVLIVAQVFSQLTFPEETDAPGESEFQTVLKAMSTKLYEGGEQMEAKVVSVTATSASLNEVMERHKYDSNTMQSLIEGIENIDVTETAVKLQNVKLQLEASYAVSATLASLNLVSYLGPG